MVQGSHRKRLAAGMLFAAVLAVTVAPAAGAKPGPARHGALTPDLVELADPAVAAKPPPQQARAVGLPVAGPGSLIHLGPRVLVEIRSEEDIRGRLDALRDAGATIVSAGGRYETATAAVPPSSLRAIAGVAGVVSVSPVPSPVVSAAECEGGSVISEGVAQINAKAARDAFGLDGGGITVGVLSDSYNKANQAVSGGPVATKAAQDVSTGDLPGLTNPCLDQKVPVDVVREFAPSEPGEEAFDEGRAMLQIVHDVAPAANLAFASAFLGEIPFAESIEELAEPVLAGGAGARVIVDDIVYLQEPFFQDGPVAAAVNKVTAEGVTYLSAAGNDNSIDSGGRDIASWEAPAFRDAGSCPPIVAAVPGANGSHCMDFDSASTGTDTSFGIVVEPNETLTVDLQWAEPRFGVATDIDAYLLDAGGAKILEEAPVNNLATQKPVELLGWENESASSRTVQLAINRFSGANPRLKFVLLQGGVSAIEYPAPTGGDLVGPSVFGHSGSASAIGVGAVHFANSTRPERYSSRGPVTHLFGEVNGSSPAAALAAPQVIPKPDVVATDCGATTFFAHKAGSTWRFCGTSAAAPHAAGAVALMMEAALAAGGGLGEPEPLRSALLQSASPVGAFGPCAVGAGLVEARGAVEAMLAGPGPPAQLACSSPSSPPAEEAGPPASVPMPPAETTVTPSPTPPRQLPPRTTILRHPPKLVRTDARRARVVFRFGSDQTAAIFVCKFDRSPFRVCPARVVRRLRLGSHVLRVKARNGASGLTDPTPAVFSFRIERR